MLVVGLTGSIGMGKSTTAAMFAARGVPVHDADAAVHRLYRSAAVAPLEAIFPGVAVNGAIDRALLSQRVVGDPAALAKLETVVHPLVRASEAAFLSKCRAAARRVVLLDMPLLFETGSAERVDVIVLVSAGAEVQHARVLGRPGMTEEKFKALAARQVPDAQKRRQAHFLLDTGRGFAFARREVCAILAALAFAF